MMSLPVEWLIDTFSSMGFPMWESIILCTILFRLLLIPITIIQMKYAIRLESLTTQLRANTSRVDIPLQERNQKTFQILKQHGGEKLFLIPILLSIIQIPVFITLFTAIAYMSGNYYSFVTLQYYLVTLSLLDFITHH
jgi:membrane protein insertase Oxa1/YidC/SpoIIIJ